MNENTLVKYKTWSTISQKNLPGFLLWLLLSFYIYWLQTTSFELKKVTFETNPRDKTPNQADYMWLKDKALLLETAF